MEKLDKAAASIKSRSSDYTHLPDDILLSVLCPVHVVGVQFCLF